MLEYRKRCYDVYSSKHWIYTHSLSREEYELFYKVAHKRFKNILPKDKSVNIIDIACGAGHFLYFLQKEGYTNIKGIDLSREQLDVARKMGIKNIEQADLFEYLRRSPETFDVIVANDIIEHLHKDEVLNFLDLIHSSLKQGGMVILSTLNAFSLFGVGLVYIDFTHELGFTPTSLSQIMRVSKFEDVQVYGEVPVAHDLRSSVRYLLWFLVKKIVKGYLIIEMGTGRNLFKTPYILEPRMFAVGLKR